MAGDNDRPLILHPLTSQREVPFFAFRVKRPAAQSLLKGENQPTHPVPCGRKTGMAEHPDDVLGDLVCGDHPDDQAVPGMTEGSLEASSIQAIDGRITSPAPT